MLSVPRRLMPALASFVLFALCLPAFADVKTTSQNNSYAVPGTTAKALVSYMLRNPFPGDHGAAFANIRPNYSLSVTTKESGGICRATDVDVKIHFVITLPVAADAKRMSRKTVNAWNNFVAFARRHEETHRASYINCAKAFVAAAQRQKGSACYTVSAEVREMFSDAKRDCEVKQSVFDRQQKGVLRGLTLVRQAGY